MYKEIKHTEIMQEKERYELLLKIKELKNKVTEQKKDIKTQESKISSLKRKANEAEATKQLASMHGAASFTSSTTPDRAGSATGQNESPDIDPTSSILSADPSVGGGLQVVAEEPRSDGGDEPIEGGLDFNEEQQLEGQNDEL